MNAQLAGAGQIPRINEKDSQVEQQMQPQTGTILRQGDNTITRTGLDRDGLNTRIVVRPEEFEAAKFYSDLTKLMNMQADLVQAQALFISKYLDSSAHPNLEWSAPSTAQNTKPSTSHPKAKSASLTAVLEYTRESKVKPNLSGTETKAATSGSKHEGAGVDIRDINGGSTKHMANGDLLQGLEISIVPIDPTIEPSFIQPSSNSSPMPNLPPLPIERTKHHRPAKAAAVVTLQETVIPDMNRYEAEERHANDGSKKRKASKMETIKEQPQKRPKPSNDAPTVPNKPAKSEQRAMPASRKQNTVIKVVLSNIGKALSKKQMSTLKRLGIEEATRPEDCTHLVVGIPFKATSKYLCALSNAPVVVNSGWLESCAEEGKVVDSANYILHDQISEIVTRAADYKKNKRKLLTGHLFYLSANLQKQSYDSLQNIVVSADGQVSSQAPDPSLLLNKKSTHHFIGTLEDKQMFDQVTRGRIAVYNPSLIFEAVKHQHPLALDSPQFLV